MADPTPSDLLTSARAHSAHSAARTNLLLEALVVASLSAQPKPRKRPTPKPPTEASTPPDA